MASPDVQLVRSGPTGTPEDYVIPATAILQPLAINAVFDGSAAGGSYLPCVVIIGNSGTVIARSAADTTVAAGDGAEVSWFPGVKNSVATAVAPVAWLSLALDTDAGDAEFFVPDNTVTHVEFLHEGTSVSSSLMQPRTGASGNYDGILLRNADYLYFIQSSLLWHANGFKQYALIEGPGPDYGGGSIAGAVSNHGEQPAATTDGSIVFGGDGLWMVDMKTYQPATIPTTIRLDAFQQSGITQGVVQANLTVIAYKVF